MAFTGSGSAGGNPNDVPRDRHKRYLIPRYPLDGPMAPDAEPILGEGMLQPYTRVSTIAKAMADQFGLTRWQIRMVVKGISLRPDLYALAAATRIDDTRQLDDIGDQAKDAAKARAGGNLGTALHAFTDQVDAGETPEIPAPWDADIAAYTKGLADHGIKIVKEWRERRVVLPQFKDGKAAGVAGTLDSIVLYNGVPTIADLKTGKDPLKYGAGEIAIQEGCYGNAWAMFDGEYFAPMPKGVNRKVALVFHLRPGEARLDIYEVDISGAMEDVALAMQVRAWRAKVSKLYTLITPGTPASEIAVLETEVQPDAVPTDLPDKTEVAFQAPGKTADMLEQERIRDERLAAISKDTNPNDGDPDDALDAKSRAIVQAALDGTGQPLAPIAVPPAKGCSVCRRTGHRKGSPKCLGLDDPALQHPNALNGHTVSTGPAKTVEQAIANGDPQSVAHAARAADAIWCGCTNRAAGWKADPTNPDGPWICGDCGLPSKEVAIQTEMSDGDHDTRASAVAAVEHAVGDQVTVAGATFTKTGESPFPGDPRLTAGADDGIGSEEPDPFADEDGDPPILSETEQNWHLALDEITAAESKADIRDARAKATEAGVWDDQLLQAGLKRLKELTQAG